MMKKNIIISMAVMLLGLASCETKDNHAFTPPAGPEPTMMYLEIMGERYQVNLSTNDTLNLRTYSYEFPVEYKVLNYLDFNSVSIGKESVVDGVATMGISVGRQVNVKYETASKEGSFLINIYPYNAPTFKRTGHARIPGDFYLSFIYQPLIMKIYNGGSLMYYRFVPTEANGTFKELGYWDFKKHVFDGKTYYSYHAPDYNFADKAVTGYVPGMRILMDDHYNPIDTIHALASRDGYLPEGSPLDGHDFYFFSPTHWIASASYVEREVNGKKLAVAYLQEVDNGEVVFDWWSTEHPEMMQWASSAFDTSYDYVHFNSIDVLPDGNWLLSFRALSTIVKVKHGGDGDILWWINGEKLDSISSFSGQHYARYHKDFDGEYITVFDNGNAHNPSVTRALRLYINKEFGYVERSENLLDKTTSQPYFTQACGAFQDFGDQGFVMGWGWSTEPGNCTRLVSEFDSYGHEIFRLDRDDPDDPNPMSVNPSYRCVKCP